MTEFIQKDNYDSPALKVHDLPTAAKSNKRIKEEAPAALRFLQRTGNSDLIEALGLGKKET